MQTFVIIYLLTGIVSYAEGKNMIIIERNKHCVIVYDEIASRGINFPNTKDKDVNLYIHELKECVRVIKPGTVLVPLLFDSQYKENSRPMQLFLKNNNIESILQEDLTATELYEFYFAHAIPQISPAGVSYIFCVMLFFPLIPPLSKS